MTIFAIYAAGALFFLLQANLYAKITRERIIGALTWPVLVFVLPHIIYMYRVGHKKMAATLRHNERMGIKRFRIGDRWGIGA